MYSLNAGPVQHSILFPLKPNRTIYLRMPFTGRLFILMNLSNEPSPLLSFCSHILFIPPLSFPFPSPVILLVHSIYDGDYECESVSRPELSPLYFLANLLWLLSIFWKALAVRLDELLFIHPCSLLVHHKKHARFNPSSTSNVAHH